MHYLNLFSLETWNEIFLVLSAAFYLIECFFGYKCIKALVAVVGFIVGFVLGFSISAGYFTDAAYIPALIGIAAGILLALIAFKLYLVGVFIFCGTVAFQAVGRLPLNADGAQEMLKSVLCIAAFIIVGILAVKFSKWCIILITSITGSINAINLLRTPIPSLDSNTVLRIAVIALVAVCGIMVQRAMNGRR